MTVRVRLFAGLRERAGWSERELEAATVADVWPALDLGPEPNGLLYAVNREYAARDRGLADGDEVAVIPPVSGGDFLLSDEPLSLDRVVDEVRDDAPARSRPSRASPGSRRAGAPSRSSSTRHTREWPSRRCGGSPRSCARATT